MREREFASHCSARTEPKPIPNPALFPILLLNPFLTIRHFYPYPISNPNPTLLLPLPPPLSYPAEEGQDPEVLLDMLIKTKMEHAAMCAELDRARNEINRLKRISLINAQVRITFTLMLSYLH